PHLRPSGNWPQSTPGLYGFGRSLGAPSRDIAGSFTGYCPGGNIGNSVAALPAGGVTEAGPQASAPGPGEPCATTFLAPNSRAPATTTASTTVEGPERKTFVWSSNIPNLLRLRFPARSMRFWGLR